MYEPRKGRYNISPARQCRDNAVTVMVKPRRGDIKCRPYGAQSFIRLLIPTSDDVGY